MPTKNLEVISEFNPKKDYGIKIENQVAKVLSSLKKDDKFSTKEFINNHLNEFSLKGKKVSYERNQKLVYDSFKVGRQIGILKELDNGEMSFNEFVKFESIQTCKTQLRGLKYKNLPNAQKSSVSTQMIYLYHLWDFSKWLKGRQFEYDVLFQQNENDFKKIKKTVPLENLEDLLKIYENSHSNNNNKPFRQIIRKYLEDQKHVQKKASSLNVTVSAIKAYFRCNDTDFDFFFDPKKTHESGNSDEDEAVFTLLDLFKILTDGKPSITQKAVILCKFHRGLDTSTLVDRFNYQAWEQLVKYFGTDTYMKWDLDLCPVPIKLQRIKKDFTHTGFLDRDAITYLQIYLDFRFKKTGKSMKEGEPLFLNARNEAITPVWVRMSFGRMAKTAGIQRKLKGYNLRTRYEKDSHELRDLLKSTLINCGTRYDVADHVIGHMPKDTYEKQHKIFSPDMRFEFMKASGKINIFSNYAKNIEGSFELQNLYNENEKMKVKLSKLEDNLEMVLNHQRVASKFQRKKSRR